MRALVVAAIVAGAGVAHADEASDLFEQGRKQKDAGELVAACKSFEQSYNLERAAGTALNVAECEESAGNWEYALELYDGAAKVFDSEGQAVRADFARKRAAKLRADHAPKPVEKPAAPTQEAPKDKTWLLGVGIGATTISVLGVIGIVYSYGTINDFERTDLSSEYLGGKTTVSEEDCGELQFTSPEIHSKFEDACAADQRLHWLIPTTFASGVIGLTTIAYYLYTRPKRRSSMAVMPTASGGVVAAFEW